MTGTEDFASPDASQSVLVRHLGTADYVETVERMRGYTRCRDRCSLDEFWVLQHSPVYTQGYSCAEVPHVRSQVPVVGTDRGGQLTYHGPGQLIVYLLVDLRRRRFGVRRLVGTVESSILELLRIYGIEGSLRAGAPGVYVAERKIASLGFRVVRGCSYHGLSLNVDVDTGPFGRITICGQEGLEAITMKDLGIACTLSRVADDCVDLLARTLGYCEVRKAPSKM